MSRTPDGLLALADGITVAVELELTTESRGRYNEILGATAAHRPAKRVWWFVKSAPAREISKVARPFRLPEGSPSCGRGRRWGWRRRRAAGTPRELCMCFMTRHMVG